MSQVPACVCTAHPKGEDKRKWMIVAEETPERVVFCCKRCTEITRTAVIQVRTLSGKAKYEVSQQRKQMDPELLKMIEKRKRGGVRVHHPED